MPIEEATYQKPANTFMAPGQKKAGCPYRIQNGNYGVYLPKNFFGVLTAGRKMVIDLKTKSLTEADERIEAIGLWVQLASCKAETF